MYIASDANATLTTHTHTHTHNAIHNIVTQLNYTFPGTETTAPFNKYIKNGKITVVNCTVLFWYLAGGSTANCEKPQSSQLVSQPRFMLGTSRIEAEVMIQDKNNMWLKCNRLPRYKKRLPCIHKKCELEQVTFYHEDKKNSNLPMANP